MPILLYFCLGNSARRTYKFLIMKSLDVTISVEQIFPNGKSEYHCLSVSSFHSSVPFDSVFSSFKEQVSDWLDNELVTGSSFRFSFAVIPCDHVNYRK